MTSVRICIASLTVTASRGSRPCLRHERPSRSTDLDSPLRSAVALRYPAPPRRQASRRSTAGRQRARQGSQRTPGAVPRRNEGKTNGALPHDTTIPRSTPQNLPAPRRGRRGSASQLACRLRGARRFATRTDQKPARTGGHHRRPPVRSPLSRRAADRGRRRVRANRPAATDRVASAR